MYAEAYNQKTNERERRGQKAQLDTGKHQVECLKLGVRVGRARAEHQSAVARKIKKKNSTAAKTRISRYDSCKYLYGSIAVQILRRI